MVYTQWQELSISFSASAVKHGHTSATRFKVEKKYTRGIRATPHRIFSSVGPAPAPTCKETRTAKILFPPCIKTHLALWTYPWRCITRKHNHWDQTLAECHGSVRSLIKGLTQQGRHFSVFGAASCILHVQGIQKLCLHAFMCVCACATVCFLHPKFLSPSLSLSLMVSSPHGPASCWRCPNVATSCNYRNLVRVVSLLCALRIAPKKMPHKTPEMLFNRGAYKYKITCMFMFDTCMYI